MSLLPLTTLPNAILHKTSKDLPMDRLREYKSLGEDMIETMLASDGIGLAAVQIGKNINLFTINKDVTNSTDHLVLCNPTITFQSRGSNVMEEGCLSCPGIYGNVRRPEKVRVTAFTLDGEKIQFKAKGMIAKVFQHEIDHLQGTLIVDKFEK